MSEGFQALSEREKETLRLLLGGHDIKSIATDLGLSVHTVNERLREARRKLGASSSRQAARILASAEQAGPKFSADNFSGDPDFPADKQSGVAGAALHSADHEHPHRTPGGRQSIAWLAGGMLIMSLIIAAAVLAMLQAGDKTPAQAQAPARLVAAAPNTSESAASARQWLALIDSGQWEQSFNAAGELFKSHITAADWAARVKPVREPLGAVSSRTLKTVMKATALPGAPDGKYEVLQFDTNFAQKPGSVETVTLVQEGGAWKVIGYFIR